MSVISTVDLSQRYGAKTVLKGVSISVDDGEMLALIGPTGAGKTTLLRLLDQLDKPASGKIYFDGHQVTNSAKLRVEVRRQVGMVFQKPAVFNSTVFDNVAYPLRIRGHSRKPVADKTMEMLEIVGLKGYEKRSARTLSGGETQKVALARAMVSQPRLMLLDEPTANLDPVSLGSIEEVIQRVNRQYGTAMIIATHDMSQGRRLASRIGVLMEGELVQTGTASDVFSRPSDIRVARLVGVENVLEGTLTTNEEGLTRIQIGGHTLEAVTDIQPTVNVHVFLRPEDITLSVGESPSSARNSFTGEVTLVALSGALARVEMDCGFKLVALITRRSADDLELRVGTKIHASFKATALHVVQNKGAS